MSNDFFMQQYSVSLTQTLIGLVKFFSVSLTHFQSVYNGQATPREGRGVGGVNVRTNTISEGEAALSLLLRCSQEKDPV